MVSDPDEHFDEFILKSAKGIAQGVERMGINYLLVWAHDVFPDDENGKPVENPEELTPDYKKNLFYKLIPDAKYVGIGVTQNFHEDLQGSWRMGVLPKTCFYRHIKTHVTIWENSVRAIWIGGGGMNLGNSVSYYPEFCRIAKEKLGMTTWYQFRDYLKAGNIDPELKQYIINNRNHFGHDYDSEYREMFKYYFYILHPEENVDHLNIDVNDHGYMNPPPLEGTEKFVDDTYREILKRGADNPGLKNYTMLINDKKITREQFVEILKNSEEYMRMSPDTIKI